MSIDELLTRISYGDETAFERLYLETRRGLYAFLFTYLHDHYDTEDAMQTVYLKLRRHISDYDPKKNGRAWMLEIAKNHALSELRRKSRETQLEDPDIYPDRGIDTSFIITELMEKHLSEEERRIIILHVLWGYKHREIAAALGVPAATVRSKYTRATEKLKSALKEETNK